MSDKPNYTPVQNPQIQDDSMGELTNITLGDGDQNQNTTQMISMPRQPNTAQNMPQFISRALLIGIFTWAPTFTFSVYLPALVAKIYEEGSLIQLGISGAMAPFAFEGAKLWLNNSGKDILVQPLQYKLKDAAVQAAACEMTAILTHLYLQKISPLGRNLVVTGLSISMKLAFELIVPMLKLHVGNNHSNKQPSSIGEASNTSADQDTHIIFNGLQHAFSESGTNVAQTTRPNEETDNIVVQNNAPGINHLVFKGGDLIVLISAVIGMGALLAPFLEPEMFALSIKEPAASIAVSLILNACLGGLFIAHSGLANIPAQERNAATLAAHDAFNVSTRIATMALAAEFASFSPFQDAELAGVIVTGIVTYLAFEIGVHMLLVNFLTEQGLILSCDTTAELVGEKWQQAKTALISCKSRFTYDDPTRQPLLEDAEHGEVINPANQTPLS